MVAEMRIPRIDDEHRAVTSAAVPCLVLDRVVERERLAFYPASNLAADPELAILGNDQRQVDDTPHIGHAGVSRDMPSRLQDRKEDIRRTAADPADWKRFHQGRGSRRTSTSPVEPFALLP